MICTYCRTKLKTRWNSYPWAEKVSISFAVGMLFLFTLLQFIYQWSRGIRIDAVIYMTASVGIFIGSCVLITGIKYFISGQKKKGCIHLFVSLVLMYLFGRNWWTMLHNNKLFPFGYSAYYLKSIFSSFWVFMMIKAANISGKQIRKGGSFHLLTGSILYTLLSFYGIFVLDDVLQLTSVHTFGELFMEIFILSATAVIVFNGECVPDMKGIKGKLLGIGTVIVLYGCMALILFYRDGRIREILYSLGCRLLDSKGAMRDVEWLNYRMAALRINWGRDISVTDEWFINPVTHYVKDNLMIFTWKWKPLTCINIAYGRFAVGAVLLLFIGMMISAANIPYHMERAQRFTRYIRLELWLIAIMGITRELFMVDSNAGLGTVFPFLGSGVELIPLLCIMYCLPEIMDIKTAEGAGKPLFVKGKLYRQAVYLVMLLITITFLPIFNPDAQSLLQKTSGEMHRYPIVELPEDIHTFQRWEENGVSYYGKRINGNLEGYGGEMRKDSFLFSEYKNGIPNGYGLYRERDKLIFAGRFENGFMKEGVYFQESPNGQSYELRDTDGKIVEDGPDVIHYMSGSELNGTYCGKTQNGVPSGYGLMISIRDESIYFGDFQDGIRDGNGILFYNLGLDNENGDIHIITGTWTRGVLAGHGIQSYDPADGFIEADWFPNVIDAPAALKDGSWFYKPSMYEPCASGLKIGFNSNGTWYYDIQ